MLIDPATDYKAVTKSDTTVLNSFRGLYVGGGGDVTVSNPLGTSVTFVAVPTGTTLAIQGTKVMSTGTSATDIVALF